ncbi:hypothetical protein V5O48_019531, partial [Marasmius crinis-equi]
RLFSSAKLIKTTLRNKLKAEMFEVCVMLRNTLRKTHNLDLTSQYQEDSILKEMEHWTKDEEHYPRDITDFISTFSPLPSHPSERTHTQRPQPLAPQSQQQWQQQPPPTQQRQQPPPPQQWHSQPPSQQYWQQQLSSSQHQRQPPPPHHHPEWQQPPPQQHWQQPPPQQHWQQPPPQQHWSQ